MHHEHVKSCIVLQSWRFLWVGLAQRTTFSHYTESLDCMSILQNMLNAGLSAALTSVLVFVWWIFAKEIVLVNVQHLLTNEFNEVLTMAATEEICVQTLIFSFSLSFLFLSSFFLFTFSSSFQSFFVYFTLLLSSPSQQLNSCDWPSFEQGNVQGQQLSKVHWSLLCSWGLGFAENYTAIKQSPYFYADISGTQGEGCIMAVEILYEGIGTTGSVATCPALKWALSTGVTAEGNSQDTVEKSRWEKPFLSVDRLCAVWSHRYLLSVLIDTHPKAASHH